MSYLRPLRWVAVVEAISFLALLVATYVKYAHDEPLGVQVLGPIHGALFVAYLVLALLVWNDIRWRPAIAIAVLAGAVLPFGGFVVDRLILRDEESRPATS